MSIQTTWYLTPISRDSQNDATWDVDGTSHQVRVWFGTQAEFNSEHPSTSTYQIIIIDSTSTSGQSAPGLVNANELRAALVQYDANNPGVTFNIANNSGYLGTFDVNYDGDPQIEATVAFAIDGLSVESSTNAYMISLDPVTVTSFAAAYKGGVGNFDPYSPGTLRPPCFVAGTLIDTPSGPRMIESLKSGDLVLTADGAEVPVRLNLSATVGAATQLSHPELRPIRISKGALGAGLPLQDLLVSPQHRVLVRSRIAQRMFGTDEVLVAAKQLVLIDGIDIAQDLQSFTYHHLVFDQHEIVLSNGAASESLYPGPEAMRNLGRAARDEIYALFPHLRPVSYTHLTLPTKRIV